MVKASRNETLARGITRFSRSAMYQKKGQWKAKRTNPVKKVETKPTTKTVEVKGAKNGKTRTIPVTKPAKFYPAEDVRVPKKSRKSPKPTKLRASITPGTVLILLAGRQRGKRVVFLKQLEGGLLLVSGPFKVNGVPLRRVNQAYVVATSTKIDISAVKVDEKLNDAFFKKAEDKKSKKPTEEGLFKGSKKEKKPVDAARVELQTAVDTQLMTAIQKTPELAGYLKSTFSLKSGQFPHQLKF